MDETQKKRAVKFHVTPGTRRPAENTSCTSSLDEFYFSHIAQPELELSGLIQWRSDTKSK